MEVNYELTPEDYQKFIKETAKTQSFYKPLATVFAVVYLVFIFADLFYFLIFGGFDDWTFKEFLRSVALRSLITFAAVLAVLGIFQIHAKFWRKKLDEFPKNGLLCEHRLIISENELIELTDVNTARYSWKAIGAVKEFVNFVSIEVLLSGVFVIPKKYFKNQNEVENFIEKIEYYKLNSENVFQPSHVAEFENSIAD